MILDDIARSAGIRAEGLKARAEEIRAAATNIEGAEPFAFENALRGKGVSIIAEIKKASPSKGEISRNFPFLDIARQYERGGADAISVLTEPEYFLGSNEILQKVRNAVSVPVLRKDFIVDELQIYEAKAIGADAVLLICSLLNTRTIERFLSVCDSLGMSALVEAHDEEEISSALRAGARVIGVNNRNLKTFTVDVTNSMRLRALVPANVVFVSESGVKSRQDMERLEDCAVNAVLIGETLMKSGNILAELSRLTGGNNEN